VPDCCAPKLACFAIVFDFVSTAAREILSHEQIEVFVWRAVPALEVSDPAKCHLPHFDIVGRHPLHLAHCRSWLKLLPICDIYVTTVPSNDSLSRQQVSTRHEDAEKESFLSFAHTRDGICIGAALVYVRFAILCTSQISRKNREKHVSRNFALL
jgi:hypothetical protein